MLIYLLKSAGCMAVLLLFYKVVLEKERMHTFKRFYLLTSLIAALLIPALVFEQVEYIDIAPVIDVNTVQFSKPNTTVTPASEKTSDWDSFNFELLFAMLYSLGVLIFGIRFFKNLGQIIARIRKNFKVKERLTTKVLLGKEMPPHTFFRYIFLNKKKYESNSIPVAVLVHEETHARQRHSYDVLFIEFLQVVLWFNPLIYLFKKSMKLNHEFLADQAVLKKEVSTKSYQNTLLSYLSEESQRKYQSVKMANAINYSSIKKRFIIMKSQTSKSSKIIKSLLVLPLIALLLFGFSETKTIQVPLENQEIIDSGKVIINASEKELMEFNRLAKKYNQVPIENRVIPVKELRLLENVYRKMTDEQKAKSQPFPECLPKNKQQESATREQMAEYNRLAKKYNDMNRDHMRISSKEVEKLKYIYSIMSDKQRADAEPFPDFPEPPTPPKAPKEVNEREEAVKKIEKIIEEQDPYDVVTIGPNKVINSAPLDSPEVTKVLNGDVIKVPNPPMPPTPPEPIDHIIAMAKKGATFYYEGKKISSDKAIELIKNDKSLKIQTTRHDSDNPQVKISKEPIVIDKKSKRTSSNNVDLKTGNIKRNGESLFYVTKNGVTNYFNSQGKKVDNQGRKPTFYFNGENISPSKANELLTNNSSIQVTTEEYNEFEYAVVLTDLNDFEPQKYNRNDNPNSVIDLTEMIEKGASFFFNDEPISVDKAVWLTQNIEIEQVRTVGTKNGKPKVYLWKKV